MALLQNVHALGTLTMPVAQGAEVVVVKMKYSLAAALALNDVIELGPLPAGHVPVDCYIDSDELDTGVDAIVIQVGILNSGKTAIDATASGGAAWTGADTIGQAGGLSRATGNAISRVVPQEHSDQPIGIVVTTGPGTGAASGDVALVLQYRSTQLDE